MGSATTVGNQRIPLFLLCLACATASSVWAETADAVKPLANAHAHNDYQHVRPLLDALEQGFTSIEADVFLVDGQLLIGHEEQELRPDRTLKELYLRPLYERFQRSGRIFSDNSALTLLIDFKSAAEPTYAALDELLKEFRPMLVRYKDGRRIEGAVEIILSGDRPIETVARQTDRWVAIDGRLTDLATNPPVSLMPLISDRWTQHFFWNGEPPMRSDDATKLKEIVERTHQQGRRLRFWATPDRAEAWSVLREHQVDLINTDDLPGLARFLNEAQPAPNAASDAN